MEVAKFSHADWAAEQLREPVCAAAIRYISFGHPEVVPLGLLPTLQPAPERAPPSSKAPPPTQHPLPLDIRELANKGRLVPSGDVLLLVKKTTKAPSPTSTPRPGERAARLFNDESIRIYVPMPMLPWVMLACHAGVLCHLGTARTLALLQRFYWWVGMMGICTRY